MNWAQYEDPISHMCLAGAVVARGGWVAGLSPFNVINCLSLNSPNSVKGI